MNRYAAESKNRQQPVHRIFHEPQCNLQSKIAVKYRFRSFSVEDDSISMR